MSPIAALRSRRTRTIDALPGATDDELLAWSQALLAPPPRPRRTEPLRAAREMASAGHRQRRTVRTQLHADRKGGPVMTVIDLDALTGRAPAFSRTM